MAYFKCEHDTSSNSELSVSEFSSGSSITANIGDYFVVCQASDSNTYPTFTNATVLAVSFSQRTGSADRAYCSIIKATGTNIVSNYSGKYSKITP